MFGLKIFLLIVLTKLSSAKFGDNPAIPVNAQVLIFSEQYKDDFPSCPRTTPGSTRKRPSCETKPFCNGIIVAKRWAVTPAHCLWMRNISQLDVGYGHDAWMDMWHHEINYVIINKNYNTSFDPKEDYALIRIVEEFQTKMGTIARPIADNEIPIINMLKIPYRSHMRIYAFDNHTTEDYTRQTVVLQMQIYECETDRDNQTFSAVDRLICYILRDFGTPYPQFDGAMIVKDKGRETDGPPFEVFGMHVQYNYLNSWFVKVGRAINFAGRFHFWLQAAKFERLDKHIPTDRILHCCSDETIDTFERNHERYEQRRNASVVSDGDPILC